VRSYRGVRYKIKVERRGPGNNVQLEVDGNLVSGTVVPLPQNKIKEVNVFAILE
jgi:hypothetical protein